MNDKTSSPLFLILFFIALVVVFLVVGLPHFLDVSHKKNSPNVQANLRTVATALETYYIDYRAYPPAIDGSGNPVIFSATGPPCSAGYVPWLLTTPVMYLSRISLDPFAPNNVGLWLRSFRYANDGTGHWILASRGPDEDFDMAVEDYILSASGDIRLFCSHFGKGTAIEYDPTNGTFSNGDVIRIGP